MTVEKAGRALALLQSGVPTHGFDPELMKALRAEVRVIMEALRNSGEDKERAALRFAFRDRSDWSELALRLWEAVEKASSAPRPN